MDQHKINNLSYETVNKHLVLHDGTQRQYLFVLGMIFIRLLFSYSLHSFITLLENMGFNLKLM